VTNRELLKLIAHLQIHTIKEINKLADDFSALSAAVDTLVNEVNEVVQLLQSGQNNNDQSVIDALTAKLTAAANGLAAAMPAPAVAPAATDTSTTDTPAADTSATDGSTDAPAE
jgi:predicted transcriptional regulator